MTTWAIVSEHKTIHGIGCRVDRLARTMTVAELYEAYTVDSVNPLTEPDDED